MKLQNRKSRDYLSQVIFLSLKFTTFLKANSVVNSNLGNFSTMTLVNEENYNPIQNLFIFIYPLVHINLQGKNHICIVHSYLGKLPNYARKLLLGLGSFY